MRTRSLLGPLAWLLAVHVAALYVFTTGFFLTRFEVPDVSQCRVRPATAFAASAPHLRHTDDDVSTNSHSISKEDCWLPARFRRVVFVVVDALRFDFVHGQEGYDGAAAASSFYLNRLPVLNETLTTQPSHARLFKFVADPPTMTMQRLKGLTTGSLPTFMDIKDNMASSEIVEDNLLRQMRDQHRGIVFMGDDTWDALYGGAFTRKYAFDSFNVKDLDTVDNGVKRHLFPELERDDWDLLIAHFLGVDHVGHTHGPSSVFMTQKLDEMNGVLTDMLRALPEDDTLLAVLGDHGMSADGNHGGASDDETGAALFLYSKQPLVASGDEFRDVVDQWGSEVPQVDLVPTIALLCGLPIPFGNLGSVIPSLFFSPPTPSNDQTDDSDHMLASYESLAAALQLNVDQVRRYLFTYSSASKLPEQAFDELERILVDVERVQAQIELESGAEKPERDIAFLIKLSRELVATQQRYLREALSLGRSIWTQFDLCSMAWGILLMVWSILLLVTDALAVESGEFDCVPWYFVLVGVISGYFVPVPGLLPSAAFSRMLTIMAVSILLHASSRLWKRRDLLLSRVKRCRCFRGQFDSASLTALVVVVLHALALLSNSYIVAEDKVMTFLSESTGFFLLFRALRGPQSTPGSLQHSVMWASLAFIASSRLASAIDPPNIIQSTPTILRTYAPLLGLVMLALAMTASFTTQKVHVSSLGYISVVTFVAGCGICAVYWAASPIESQLARLWLPRAVYISFLTLLAASWCQLRARSAMKTDAATSLLIWPFLPCYMLVLGPSSPISVACAVVQLLSFSIVARSTGLQDPPVTRFVEKTPNHTTPTQPLYPLSPAGTAWVILFASVAYQSFFFTGHQNTFTSLQNAAGFVGFDDFNYYIAGALLGLNTFGNYALALLALPWLVGSSGEANTVLGRWRVALLGVVGYFALTAAVSTAFVALQRRHLMVWAIFAPKFLFDAVALLVLEALALLLIVPIVC